MSAQNQVPVYSQKWECFVMVTRADVVSGIEACDRILAKLSRVPADLLLAEDRKLIAIYSAQRSEALADLALYFG